MSIPFVARIARVWNPSYCLLNGACVAGWRSLKPWRSVTMSGARSTSRIAREMTFSTLDQPGKPAFHTSTRRPRRRSSASRRDGQVPSSAARRSSVVDPPEQIMRIVPWGVASGRSGDRYPNELNEIGLPNGAVCVPSFGPTFRNGCSRYMCVTSRIPSRNVTIDVCVQWPKRTRSNTRMPASAINNTTTVTTRAAAASRIIFRTRGMPSGFVRLIASKPKEQCEAEYPGQRPDCPVANVPRPVFERDPVSSRRKAHAAKEVICPVDRRGFAIDRGTPARIVLVRQDQEATVAGVGVDDDAVRRITEHLGTRIVRAVGRRSDEVCVGHFLDKRDVSQILALQPSQQARLVVLYFDTAHDEAPRHRAWVLVQRHSLIG